MLLFLSCLTYAADTVPAEGDDPHQWLEDVDGDKALDWVRSKNESVKGLSETDDFKALQERLLSIYDSDDKIPYVGKMGDFYYNFWKDADHERGIWRRTTLDSYKTDSPEWEVVLDLDALNEAEDENWVWHGSDCLYPDYDVCLISLSRGGADADVTREFDLKNKTWVKDGFFLPEAKGGASWIDRDTLHVATDFGEGSLTDSGYPRILKLWKRGTPLAEAETLYEGEAPDISISGWHDSTEGFERDFVYRGVTFYTNQMWERKKGKLLKIDKPDDAMASVYKNWLLFELRSDWEIEGTTYTQGSLIATDYKRWMKGKRDVTVIFAPTETTSLAGHTWTKNHLIVTVLDNVRNKLEVHTPPPKKGAWTKSALQGLPEFGRVSAWAVDIDDNDDIWLSVTDYLTPSSLWMGSIGSEPTQLKQTPTWFEADGLEVSQHFATSKDGTKVPYFQVAPKDLPEDGTAPTLLYGYGGFEVSLLPRYSATVGAGWLEKGGVYVVGNIRGGGEYGPRWHQAALKENRNKAYEDFAAIGEDLVKRGITKREHLGIQGGSNGGLLMGNMYTTYPQHWGAVVCQVPLLDMKRYTKLLAGASWAGEYGDPDTDDWSFLEAYSPYHNIDAEADHPPILFTTSTRDDRVHPGHARKMAAALLELDKDVLYYENIEGGHGGAANNEQAAFMSTLAYSFFWDRLSGKHEAPEGEPPEAPEPE